MANFSEINERLDTVIAHFKLKNRAELSREIGVQNAIGQFFTPPEKPKRKMPTLARKLNERYGVSKDWFLEGVGPMLSKDVSPRSEESLMFERVGRLAYAMWCNFEAVKGMHDIQHTRDIDVLLGEVDRAMKKPGGGPGLRERCDGPIERP